MEEFNMGFKEKEALFNGVEVDKLERIDNASVYDFNYYIYKHNIILGIGDDDNETKWFLIDYHSKYNLIGYSYASSSPEVILVLKEMYT